MSTCAWVQLPASLSSKGGRKFRKDKLEGEGGTQMKGRCGHQKNNQKKPDHLIQNGQTLLYFPGENTEPACLISGTTAPLMAT